MKAYKTSQWILIRTLCLMVCLSCAIGLDYTTSVYGSPQQSQSLRKAIEETLDFAGIKAGMTIGEIGAGEGFFTTSLAERVGQDGKVYANDIDQQSLDILAEKNLTNVETVLGRTDDPRFPSRDLDMVIMRSVFHDLENPLSMLENLKVYLRPGAPLIVVGPRPSEKKKNATLPVHSMTREEMLDIVDRSSFALESESLISSWWGVYVFKVEKDKEKDVWPNWLREFNQAVQRTLQFEKDSDTSPVKKRIAWERVMDSHSDNNPESSEDEQLKDFISQRIASLEEKARRSALVKEDTKSSVPQTPGSIPDIVLRSDYRSLGMDDIEEALERLGFEVRSKLRAVSGDFLNKFEAMSSGGDSVVVDGATGLVWHQSGSEKTMDYFEALEWIDDMNLQTYAGYSDWRLPTVEEAASLMETKAMNEDLHIDPAFSKVQRVIWTGDPYYGGRAWLARFNRSSFADDLKVHIGWVRPVR